MPPPIPPAEQVAELELRAGRPVRCRAAGSSMKPLIVPGADLEVQPVPAEELRPGDVLLFQDGTRLVAHRLVRRVDDPERGRLFYVQGDNRHDVEGPVPADAILGRIERVRAGWLRFRPRAWWIRAAYPPLRWGYRCAARIKRALVG